MHSIHLARVGPDDKLRPVVLLTRSIAISLLSWVTVAPITSTIRGNRTEVPVGAANGLDHDSVVNLDNIQTVPRRELGPPIGELATEQEHQLSRAVRAAFDLL
jgi:mRNA interferase MazF